MTRLFENIALDFMEEEILFCWGSPDYFETIKKLTALNRLTTNTDLKGKLLSLSQKLLLYCLPDEYPEKYDRICQELDKGMKGRVKFAKELLDFQISQESQPSMEILTS